jgi:prolyl-tRNA synthetase
MRRSQILLKTSKEISGEEQAINAQLLTKGGFIEKEMAGVYSYLPLGLRVLRKIENIIREEIEAIGGQEILMPALQPKENWETTKRWEGFDALFKVPSRYGYEFALGPTHEEIIVPLVKKYVQSYRDLPLFLYQIQTKFRDEPRAKGGLLRGREFGMKDLYSFHADEDDLNKYYEKVKIAYLKIFQRIGLKVLVVEASGGTFSKYSHEFQVLSPAGEDTIFYCQQCDFAQNKEIAEVEEEKKCPRCSQGLILKSSGIEVGNIFKLKTKYSEPFHLTFKDKDGKEKLVIMGCYGIGSSRLMGTIVEVFHDEKGIIWPASVAPFQAVIIPLNLTEEIKKASEEVYKLLRKANIETLYDDRQDVTVGEKFVEADLIGFPWRLVINQQTLKEGLVELKKRETGEIKLMRKDKLVEMIAFKS